MSDPGFAILHETATFLVVAKPAGVLTQAPPGIDSLELRVRRFLHDRDGRPLAAHLGVVHRLDRPATGALLLGLRRQVTRALGAQCAARTVTKRYWAAVSGTVSPTAGTWTDYLRKVPDEPRAEVVAADHPDARPATLHYRVLAAPPWGTWLEIDLATGRTHQIRIQAATRGHAVLGDAAYGSHDAFGPPADDPRQRAIALHARTLAFANPADGAAISVAAPLPEAWQALGLDRDGGQWTSSDRR